MPPSPPRTKTSKSGRYSPLGGAFPLLGLKWCGSNSAPPPAARPPPPLTDSTAPPLSASVILPGPPLLPPTTTAPLLADSGERPRNASLSTDLSTLDLSECPPLSPCLGTNCECRYLRRLQEAAAAAAAMTNGGGNDVNGQATPIVPSHTRTSASTGAGYFPSAGSPTTAAATSNGQMVVPSQAPSSAGYAATHSFMDTNTIAHPHHTSPLHHQHHAQSLPSLNTQLGVGGIGGMTHYNGAHQSTSANGVAIPTLPSLPSLTSMNWSGASPSANGTGPSPHQPTSATSSHNPQSAVESSWLQQTHVPMHLQPSPARLSPILGHASNLNLPSSNGIGGSAAGLSNLATTAAPPTGGPIPPSRYPIAADLNGLANAVRPQSSKGPTSGSANPAVSTGNGNTANGPTGGSSGSSHTSGTPPPTAGASTTSTAVDPHHPHHRDASPASSTIIGQHVHGHYSQLSGGFLPAFVRSRASSPVPGEQGPRGLQNGSADSQFANGLGGPSAVPLTPTTAAEIFPQHPLYNWSMPYKDIESANSPELHRQQPQQHTPNPNSQLIHPPLSAFHRAHSLETIAPMPLIMHILSLFFDYVYPLTPCVHKPSFYEGLREKREEKDPLFFALVCSTLASTLVQVPRSYLPMERDEVRKLAKRFEEASRLVTMSAYDPPQSILVVIRYFDNVYHFCEGHDAASHAAFGEAAHIAVTLHMHEEASYEGLDFIESEVRRRAFWLLFGADKSMSILLGRPICLRDEDCTLHFPREVDDEYITAHAILPQPPNKTAIVSGLNYISRIFALLGEILVRIRVDKRSPPQGPFATARLEEVRALHTRICSALAHAPPELRLGSKGRRDGGDSKDGAPGTSPGGGINFADFGGPSFTEGAFAELKEFFDSPNANRENASNPFMVMQANLYVTQQLVRFVIEQYRHELITLMRENGTDPSQCGSIAAAAELARGGWTSEDREAVASDLLNVLHSIPITSIATNGPSLVHKVRFVASTLLDSVRKAETAPASAARAHAYLWDFLSILSEIERNYL
ncbi:hypothetical protein FS837_011538 [Tulasnella sp. UAMH 9824]|nr:hypothetical protein FS837_011538 [Tulasnella sp. UAMH 9824]